MQGGGGPLLTGTSAQTVSEMSSRIYFGICPTIPVVRNVGQTLNPSCSTREKRHREKRGFRLVPLRVRAVPGDKFLSLRVGFTMADRLSRIHNGLVGLRSAFTMAEILLSLTIIGVVAAITLPSLTGNINERTWNTQRKALYARFSQAIALMPALNGYGTLTEGDSSTSAVDTAAETFVTAGLSKVLKINNICDHEHLEDCGIPSKIINLTGSALSSIPTNLYDFNDKFNTANVPPTQTGITLSKIINTNAAAFETANGESILVYYNPSCRYSMDYENEDYHHMQLDMCANFVYDLNGTKGPNTVGKDIGFMAAVYPSDPVVTSVLPLGYANPSIAAQIDASRLCNNTYSDSRAPNLEEAMTLFYNKELVGGLNDGVTWTTKVRNSSLGYTFWPQKGLTENWSGRDAQYYIYCIKRPD